MTDITYCSGMRCGRKNICALWSNHHLKSPFENRVISIAQFADHAGRCDRFELRVTKEIQRAPIPLVQPQERFPEDDLPLLGPDINSQTAESFHAHITSLTAAQKTRPATMKRPKLRGKIKATPTKKRKGVYEITLMPNDICTEFELTKDKKISRSEIERMVAELDCPHQQMCDFLAIKKFEICD